MSNNSKKLHPVPAPQSKTLYDYYVLSARSKMPVRCWGRYGHVAVMRTVRGAKQPRIIREIPGTTIVRDSGPCNIGKTDRCAFDRAASRADSIAEACELRQYYRHLAQMQDFEVAPSGSRLDGDMIAIYTDFKRGRVTRYNVEGKKTGVALWDRVNGKWEHGRTFAECRAELRHKAEVEVQRVKDAEKHRFLHCGLSAAIDEGLRIMSDLVVDFETARSAGLCRQGIELFCVRHQFDVSKGATVGEILATGNHDGIRACRKAVEKQILDIVGVSC